MINEKTILPGSTKDTIDFNKLSIVVKSNYLWLVIILILINGISFLYVRYTKNTYESSSELKLEVKNEATELGIKNAIADQNLNLLSGEIELIQSKLFLNKVLESAPLDVSYFGVGRVLNEELFPKTPFEVKYRLRNTNIQNVPIYFEENDDDEFRLRIGEGNEIAGRYGQLMNIAGNEVQILRNEGFDKRNELGYFFIINSPEVLLNYLRSSLTVEPLNYNANTLRIAFKDHNAHKAQYVLNKIDTLYLQYSYEQKNLTNRQKIEWLSNEMAQIESKMEGYEDYFENFTLENKTNNLDADLTKMIVRINELDSQRYNITQKINRMNTLAEGLDKRNYLVSLAERPYLPEQLNKTLDDLYELVLDQEKLKMSYHETTFAFRQAQKEMETLRDKALTQLSELREDSEKRLIDLNQRKRSLEAEFANLPDKNTQFSKNLRFYKLNEQLYLALMQSKAEFEVVQAGSVPDFRILSPATFPYNPISPKRLMIYGAGLVASLSVMVFFIGFMYLLNNKINSLSEMEYTLRLPVLGVIPTSRHIKENALFVLDQPKSMVSEAIRTIRTNIDFFHFHSPKKVIVLSSTVSGEGKSFIATNLGGAIGLSNKKVILLDLDMRKNKSNLPVMQENKSRGISTILIGRNDWEECVIKTPIDGLDFLPSGPPPPNPAELLLNEVFSKMLDDLKTKYDFILIDTPPVGLVTDGIIAMKHADLSVYIFRANYSRSDFMLNLQRIININKFTNITMVLNALPSAGEHKYGYGYYSEAEYDRKWKQLFNT